MTNQKNIILSVVILAVIAFGGLWYFGGTQLNIFGGQCIENIVHGEIVPYETSYSRVVVDHCGFVTGSSQIGTIFIDMTDEDVNNFQLYGVKSSSGTISGGEGFVGEPWDVGVIVAFIPEVLNSGYVCDPNNPPTGPAIAIGLGTTNRGIGDEPCTYSMSIEFGQPECGDNICDEFTEDSDVCPSDCEPAGPECGNLICEEGENFDNCPSDCDAGIICGDGIAEGGEQCDLGDLNGATCQSQGFDDGTLACTSECTFDTAACFNEDEEPPIEDFSGLIIGIVVVGLLAGGLIFAIKKRR